MRILLIDDSQNDREMIKRLLFKLKAEFVEAENGADALKIITTDTVGFELALIDYRLPDTDGISLITQIRNNNQIFPVIIVTGYGNSILAKKSIESGAIDYIEKDKVTEDNLTTSILQDLLTYKTNLEKQEQERKVLQEKGIKELDKIIELARNKKNDYEK